MKKSVVIILLLAAAYLGGMETGVFRARPAGVSQYNYGQNNSIVAAFEGRQSNVQTQGIGEVVRVLADDKEGSMHQRFIVKIASGQTILIAHNIDLAKRVASIKAGDQIEFYGEYEWNPQGGVIHWTHHDPQGRHVPGWLKHHGRTYQ